MENKELPNITIQSFTNHLKEIASNEESTDDLEIIFEIQKALRATKSQPIVNSKPIIVHNENQIVFPNTINVIQGQAGVHKSRLAEILCAALLIKPGCDNNLIGFKRSNFSVTNTVLYVDTERNLMEQFPLAIQSILIKAGYNSNEDPLNFEYISLLPIKRSRRFSVLEKYLKFLRNRTETALFIVLDVSTDCIEDFNRTDVSMELIDLMNKAINHFNVTFLCLIHENPNSTKARGHFGTELMNKASTVMQIAREVSPDETNDILKVSYLKTRSIKRPNPFHIKYCQDAKGLVCLDSKEVLEISNTKLRSKNVELFDLLQGTLADLIPMKKSELKALIGEKINGSPRTLDRKIKKIIDNETEFFIANKPYRLIKSGSYYQLTEIKEDTN